MLFTTSWDDGDTLDTRLAALLDSYGVKGTFYITKEYRKERLSEDAIRELAVRHEVGAHTLTHPDLRSLGIDEQRKEIAGSREWLESVVGKEVPMFCYPSGRYNSEVAEMVRASGYKGARTVVGGDTGMPKRPFEMGTTLQIYPYPRHPKRGFEPLLQRYGAYRHLGVAPWQMLSWLSAAKVAFDNTHGEVFHLWGHSWEIDINNMWDELEKFLAFVASKSNVSFVTNGELI